MNHESSRMRLKYALYMVLSVMVTLVSASSLDAQSVDAGIALFKDEKFDQARAVFFPLAARDPVAAFYLGQIEMNENADDKAADWFEMAIRMSPRNSVYYDWLGRAYGRQAQHASRFRLPFLARKTKNAWDTSLALDTSNIDVREDLISYYTQAPGFLGGSREKARQMVAEIRERNPYRGAIAAANLCIAEKDSLCIERELNAMTAAYPDSAGAFASLASYYANEKMYDKAFALLDDRLRTRPNEQSSLFQLGRTAAMSGQNLDRGELALRKYLATPIARGSPPAANAHFRLGMIYEKKGAKELARREYQISLQLNPRLEEAQKALDSLGR